MADFPPLLTSVVFHTFGDTFLDIYFSVSDNSTLSSITAVPQRLITALAVKLKNYGQIFWKNALYLYMHSNWASRDMFFNIYFQRPITRSCCKAVVSPAKLFRKTSPTYIYALQLAFPGHVFPDLFFDRRSVPLFTLLNCRLLVANYPFTKLPIYQITHLPNYPFTKLFPCLLRFPWR
jgi:hypothetical protein